MHATFRFGRRPIFITSAILHILSGISIATSWHVVVYLLANLFCGIAGQFNFLATFVLGKYQISQKVSYCTDIIQ